MRLRRRSHTPHAYSKRPSFRPSGRRGHTTQLGSLVRSLFLAGLTVVLGTAALFSLRFEFSSKLTPLLRWLPEATHGLAEHAPFPSSKKQRLRSLLSETPADFSPMSHLFATHPFAFETKQDLQVRVQQANSHLVRAHARQSIAQVPGNEALLSLVETLDGSTGTQFRRNVLVLLPGERIHILFPAQTQGQQTLELRLGCLAATADRLDAPAKGALTLASGEERSFEVSPRGEKSSVTLSGQAGEHVSLKWPSSSPGFLVVEGWRDAGAPPHQTKFNARGLIVVSIDSVMIPSGKGGALPETFAALQKKYGQGNTAIFEQVMPETVDANTVFENFFQKRNLNAVTGHRNDVENGDAGTESLYTLATRAGMPVFETRIEALDRRTGVPMPPPLRTESDETPEVPLGWTRGQSGEPLTFLTFPRKGELRHALAEALEAHDLTRPLFSHVSLQFPDEALAPTWKTALSKGIAALPKHMVLGLARSLGMSIDRSFTREEKSAQIDFALSEFLTNSNLASKHDFALILVKQDNAPGPLARLPAPPKPGLFWYASPSWQKSAPRVTSLTALGDLSNALAVSLQNTLQRPQQTDVQTGESTAVTALLAAARAEKLHTVTEGPEGLWHLFPYGRVLVPNDPSGSAFSPGLLGTRSVWDVPLERARDARRAMQDRRALMKERVVHFFFPPSGIQESVSASLQWPLAPLVCSQVDSPERKAGAAPARGVVEKADKTDRGLSGGYRIWLTAVADPARGAHLVCVFEGGARASAEVEMHFERGSQSLALTRVGLGEFASPLPESQEGVHLAQSSYETISNLLSADYAPVWTSLSGYGVYLWEDPNPRLQFAGAQPLVLRRKDKETEEQKRLEDHSRTAGSGSGGDQQ